MTPLSAINKSFFNNKRKGKAATGELHSPRHTGNDISVLKSNIRVTGKMSIEVVLVFYCELLILPHTDSRFSKFEHVFVCWEVPWRLFSFIFINFRFLSPEEFVSRECWSN